MIDTLSIPTTTRTPATATPKGAGNAPAQGAQPVVAVTPNRAVANRDGPAASDSVNDGERLNEGLTKPTESESADALSETVDELNGLMQAIRRELQFSVDEDSGRTVIKVIDSETQEIVRQIPAEEASAVANSLGGKGVGLTRGVRV